MSTRPTIAKRLRYEILRRDGFACRACHAADVPLVVDHVVPVSLGGATEPGNLQALCDPCNSGKGSTGPDADLVAEVDERARQWSRAMSQAALLVHAQDAPGRAYADEVLRRWRGWSFGDQHLTPPEPTRDSLILLHDRGLPLSDALSAVDVAMNAHHVKWGEIPAYFIGVARNKLERIVATAEALLAEPDLGAAQVAAALQAADDLEATA